MNLHGETMVSKATILTNSWDVIRTLLVGNSTVTGLVAATKIHSAYPGRYINKGGGLPFIVIHKPEITEEKLTMTKKRYPISIDIESFSDNADKAKQVSDAIRNALEGNRATFRTTDEMFNFRVTSDTKDFDLRGNKRVHIDRLTCEFDFMGAS